MSRRITRSARKPARYGHSISNVRFSNEHRAKRASNGEINQVMPRTSSRESSDAYSQRVNRRGLTTQAVQRSRVRGIIIGAIVVVVAIVAAIVVWNIAYKASVSGKMALNDDAVTQVLSVPSNADDPYYVLLAGEYSTSGQDYQGPGMLSVVRIDARNHQATLVYVPTNIEMMLSDGKYHCISYAQVLGGDAELISTISSALDVSIAHYIKTDANSFVSLVDSLGGIDVDLPVEIDDPQAGDIYIPAGQQHLDGASALVASRATNYVDPVDGRANTQSRILFALADAVGQQEGVVQAASIDAIAGDFKTDMSTDDLTGLIRSFSDESADVLYSTKVPGSKSVESDGTYWSMSKSGWSALKSVIDSGGDPSQKGAASSVDPASVSITVRNGAGITGGASQMASLLSAQGYKIADQGNADSYVYEETLVVYKDEAKKDVANEIVGVIGSGRSVEAGYFYTFDSDILVIIGKDWKPIS